jgi:Flp pilus assembly protein TadD
MDLKAQANFAATLLSAQRYSEACDAFAKAITLSPNDPDLRTNEGIALQKVGRSAEAKEAFDEAAKIKKQSNSNSSSTHK